MKKIVKAINDRNVTIEHYGESSKFKDDELIPFHMYEFDMRLGSRFILQYVGYSTNATKTHIRYWFREIISFNKKKLDKRVGHITDDGNILIREVPEKEAILEIL